MSRIDELRCWREQAQREIEDGRVEISRIQARLKEVEERLSLVDRLIALEGGKEDREMTMQSDSLLDACTRLMRDKGQPMHVSELHQLLLAQGVPIPGKGTEANLIVRLQRSDGRFIRTGKGTYSLAEFGLPEVKPHRRRRRVKG